MSGVEGPGVVVDDAANERLIIEMEDATPELVYRASGGRLILLHTEVPERLRRRGIAGRLVAAAVERAAAERLTVVPVCPYVRKWLQDHPDAARTVNIDWRR